MNEKLLVEVKEAILAHPEHFGMHGWMKRDSRALNAWEWDELVSSEADPLVSCGTTACIAGWVVGLAGEKALDLNDGPVMFGRWVAERAEQLLGLTQSQTMLFFHDKWPAQFEIAYEEAATDVEAAQIAGELIDCFIENADNLREVGFHE